MTRPQSPCGFICTLLGDLNAFAERVEDDLETMHREIENKKNEVEPTTVNETTDGNSTYTEEVQCIELMPFYLNSSASNVSCLRSLPTELLSRPTAPW